MNSILNGKEDGCDHWSREAVFYHLFPLGCFAAPERNSFNGGAVNRISGLQRWFDHLEQLGVNALMLGPIFESSTHGYDTADLFRVDRRLGDNDAFASLAAELHQRGIRLVLDGVFNHTGRDFPAFRDVLARGASSEFRDWYHLDFTRPSPRGDTFSYDSWHGHLSLPKLNLKNGAVRELLLAAVSSWIERFDIDGLRLDAADSLDFDFQRELAAHCKALKPDFWLMGEVVHGDYRRWANPGGLDSTTNYEAYKGLWSSLNDRNYFEIAYTLKREFGADGLYRAISLFNFVDNHDVSRAASILKEPAHIYPLYVLLMTMPGVPSIYYGSEWGIDGCKIRSTDAPLRPALDPAEAVCSAPYRELCPVITNLVAIRRRHRALRHGDYAELHVAPEQFAFMRRTPTESVVVTLNASPNPREVALKIPEMNRGRLVDVLNDAHSFDLSGGRATISIPPRWARIMVAG
jgi:cyclomaltodextrinase / maltogenic alpha-amylase / neopullulanase